MYRMQDMVTQKSRDNRQHPSFYAPSLGLRLAHGPRLQVQDLNPAPLLLGLTFWFESQRDSGNGISKSQGTRPAHLGWGLSPQTTPLLVHFTSQRKLFCDWLSWQELKEIQRICQ